MCSAPNRYRSVVTTSAVSLCLIAFAVYTHYSTRQSTESNTVPCPQAHSCRRNRLTTEYTSDMARRLAALVRRRATAANPELIQPIRAMMDPPSSHMMTSHKHSAVTRN